MAYTYIDQSPTLEEYDSEDSISLSDEQPTQRQLNDRRLAQAINYIAEEGGDDSPGTFINRVDAIDEALLQRLSQQGRKYDPALYRRAQALVQEVQHEFEEAAQEPSSPSLNSLDSSMLGSEDEFPEYHTPSAVDALYREGEESDETPKDARPSVPDKQNKVELERTFKYGGPGNDPELWLKTIPAALHFPETFQMAHWESLKIDADLLESNKRLKAQGNIVETNVPYDHPHLERYKRLSKYDSGSRFKLPVAPIEIQISISKLGTSRNVAKVVEQFSKGTNAKELIKKDYVPRIFLDEIVVGSQGPTEIRRAVNTTPTKPRNPSVGNSVSTDPIKTTQSIGKPTGAKLPKTPVPLIKHRQKEADYANEEAQKAKERREALSKKAQEAREAARLAKQEAIKAAERAHEIQKAVALMGTPVVRRIDRTRTEAIEASGRRQSGISTGPTTPNSPKKPLTSGKAPTTSPQATVSPKRPRGRPPKSPVTASTTKPAVVPTTTPVKTPVKPKRKLSIGAKPYTPEPKKPKVTNPATSSVPGSGNKTVHIDSYESSEEGYVIKPKPKVKKPSKPVTETPKRKNIGVKTGTRVTKSTTKVGKAAAAGQAAQQAKTKRVVEEYVGEKEYQSIMEENRKKLHGDDVPEGSTRRGTPYLKR
ncbi:DUF390 domain containing protein [Pyrenophora tritici-repentis]|nr:DUF390 domain containing protein [Pyrenophora tritici-repentis]